MSTSDTTMTDQIAFVQNGRGVTWPEVTTQDLIATLVRGSTSSDTVRYAAAEWLRRMGKPFDKKEW